VDDTAWVSKLYPSASFATSYGTIAGQVFFSDGKYPAQDVLVVARAVTAPDVMVVAGISGYRFTGNPGQPYTKDYLPCTPSTACSGGTLGYNTGGSQFGSRDPSLIGLYELPVPAGQYTVEIREITGGRIGPIHPFFPLPGGIEGNWPTNGTSPGIVNVTGGQAVSDINIVLKGTDPSFDIFEHSQSDPLRHSSGQEKTLYAWLNEQRATPENGR
jgi:hypothetical protein